MKLFLTVLLCFPLVCQYAEGVNSKDYVVLFRFDSTFGLKKWTVRDSTVLELSNWPDGTPGLCGKVTYKKYMKDQKERWPSVFLSFDPPVSWSAYKAVEFRVYVDTPAECMTALGAADKKGYRPYTYPKFNPGWTTVTVDLDKMKLCNVDLEHITHFHIFKEEPPEDTVLYIGELKLIPRDTEIIKKRLDALKEELKQISSEKVVPEAFRLYENEMEQLSEYLNQAVAKANLTLEDVVQAEKRLALFRQKRQHALLTNGSIQGELLTYWASSLEKVFQTEQYFNSMLSQNGKIDAARGEGESLQLVVFPRKDIIRAAVRIIAPAKSADGTEIPLSAFRVAPVGYVWCDPPQYKVDRSSCYMPDPILTYAETIFLKSKQWQSWWLDVNIPMDQKPGLYSGELVFSANNHKTFKVPFQVNVRNFALRKGAPYPMAFSVPVNVKVPLDDMIIGDEMPATDEKRKKWRLAAYDIFLENHLNPDTLYPSTQTEPFGTEDVQYRLDRGAGHFTIKNIAFNPEAYLKHMEKYYKIYKDAGVLDKASLYGFDELHPSKIPEMMKILEQIKTKYPDIPFFTTAYDESFGTKTGLNKYVDGWIPTTAEFEHNIDKLRPLQKAGKLVWWYCAFAPFHPYPNFLIEYPSIDARMLMGMMFWKMKPDGFLYYNIAVWRDYRVLDADGKATVRQHYMSGAPITDWYGASLSDNNGDGLFVYPSKQGLVPTIRLKALRDGSEDYMYLKLLSEALKKVEKGEAKISDEWKKAAEKELIIESEIVDSMTMYTKNPDTLFAKRRRIAELLETYCSNEKNPRVEVPPYNIKTSIWKD